MGVGANGGGEFCAVGRSDRVGLCGGRQRRFAGPPRRGVVGGVAGALARLPAVVSLEPYEIGVVLTSFTVILVFLAPLFGVFFLGAG